jgi:L-ascorbate metabolism protein UlaG (beta-lactamase superfamily)
VVEALLSSPRLLPFLSLAPLLLACGAPVYRGPVSERFDGERFRYAAPFDERGPLDILRWQLFDGPDPDWPETIPSRPTTPAPAAPPGRVRVTLINHASTLIQLDQVNILTDPVWSDRVGPTSWLGPARHQAPGVRFEDLPPIHAILLSHSHFDHLDLPTLRRLARAHHPRVLAGLGTRALLEQEGVSGAEDLDWWQATTVGALTITFAPAQHWSRRGLADHNHLLWGSFLVAGPSGSAYFAGDTGWGPHFAEIRARLGAPSLALLPIGAYQPRWFMRSQHIDPDEAVAAHLALGASRSVAIHWGTFDQSNEGVFDPVRDLWAALARRGLPEEAFLARFNGGVVEAP